MQRSTLAWFRARDVDGADALDDTALLIGRLRAAHEIDVYTATTAHDFVWRHFRAPYALCVYELRPGREHGFIPPYLVHYPGIVLWRGYSHGARRLLQSAQLIVTPHTAAVAFLQDEHPAVPVRYAPAAIAAVDSGIDETVIALQWPPDGDAPTKALTGMAAGRPVIVFETGETADWPALNPQTWQPRDMRAPDSSKTAAPIVVSIDPRDEDHSLRLAMQRLSSDAALRQELGDAARRWWGAHATPDHAVRAWEQIIAVARSLPPPAPPHDRRPPQDGTDKAREILAEFGMSVDLF